MNFDRSWRSFQRSCHRLAWPLPSLGLGLAVLMADQVTKSMAMYLAGGRFVADFRQDVAISLVGDFVWMFVAYNPGAALSFSPQDFLPFLPVAWFYTGLVAAVAWFLVGRWKRAKDPLVRSGVAVLLGGAVGNLVDRIAYHHVVDFISVGVPGLSWRWPTFNLADCAIFYGAFLLAWGEWNQVRIRDHRQARHLPDPEP